MYTNKTNKRIERFLQFQDVVRLFDNYAKIEYGGSGIFRVIIRHSGKKIKEALKIIHIDNISEETAFSYDAEFDTVTDGVCGSTVNIISDSATNAVNRRC